MSSWEELDACLDALCAGVGSSAFVLTDASKAWLSPAREADEATIDRLERAFRTLAFAHGPSFMRRGRARRRIHRVAGNTFVAEPVASTYLLIVLDPSASDAAITEELDTVRLVLDALMERLPPLDGSRSRAAQRLRG